MHTASYAIIFAIFLPFLATKADPNNSKGSEEVTSSTLNCETLQNGQASEEQALLCHFYESSRQLVTLINEGINRLSLIHGLISASDEAREKRKHEYLRFGKRKHEYLRFGKRKHEYLRFGR